MWGTVYGRNSTSTVCVVSDDNDWYNGSINLNEKLY